MTSITASPVSVDFHGTAIPTFNVEGVVRVAMKPICDGIGLRWQAQFNRIKRHPVLSQGVFMMDIPSKGGIQKYLTLPLNKLNGWLFGIDTNRVKPEIRERLVEYQAECFDVLADYWQKGEAVNPRATTVDERRPLNRAVRTLANLRSARGETADYAGMWKMVNGYLGVASIEDANDAQLEQAMGFVQDAIETEASRVIEGDFLDSHTPAATARLDVPFHKPWHEHQTRELWGDDVIYHSRLGMMLKALREAGREGVMMEIGDISGAAEELLAYRHHLEVQECRGRQRDQNLLALMHHCHALEREFMTTVGPAIKPLNPRLYGDWRERLGSASRLAESIAH